jgi:DNA polymerase-3 subunit epsilon
MREIIFDTETTGLDSRLDRVIEIGAIELVNRFPTGDLPSLHRTAGIGRSTRTRRPCTASANADLAGKPAFSGIADEFAAFIDGRQAGRAQRQFRHRLHQCRIRPAFGLPAVGSGRVVDTLALARRKHPMGPNSLDALCKRYGIDNSHRTKHGALLDSELLAEVYIELIGGQAGGARPGSGGATTSRRYQGR